MDLLTQLQTIANAHAPKPPVRFNPRPPGVIQPGSASDAVLKFLHASPGMWTEAQIRWATRRGHSSVSWGLLYLSKKGLIESRLDPARNSRYRRYRAVPTVLP